jgi:signal transduction histidine kinase
VETRWRSLIEAGIAVTSELSLDAALQKIVEAAAALTGARYAALGVIDHSGRRLERFLTAGIDAETHERIGDLPHGRGILGVLIRDARTLRLHDLTSDRRSVGFPPHHPLMRTFLGVPILLRGVAYGNLYLTEKEGGEDFTAEDEELTTLLASQAAVAIENARLYESATRWLAQLESLTEVGNALAEETELAPLLELIASRLRSLIHCELVVISLPTAAGDLRIEAASGPSAGELIGTVLSREGSKSGRVLERRRSERVDSTLDDLEVDQEIARRMGFRSGLFVPLLVKDRPIGVIAAHNRIGPDPRFTDEELRLAETFGARAAVAVDLSDRVARDALRRVVAGQELERRRLARELHDETGQTLTSILLGLKHVEDAKSLKEARAAVAAARLQVVETLQSVRRLAVELRPKALDDFGLVPALEHLGEAFAEQSGIRVDMQANLDSDRLPGEVETALYRIVQEALTNVAKHAGASRVSVVLTKRGGSVMAVIEDDGKGFGAAGGAGNGLGLAGMKERMGLLDGRLAIESTEGAGTTVVAEVPLR